MTRQLAVIPKPDDVIDVEARPLHPFELRIVFPDGRGEIFREVTIDAECNVRSYSKLTIDEQCFAAEVAKLTQKFLKRVDR